MKHHPYFRSLLSSPTSSRLSYAARVLNEGGLQSVPTKLHFPGGAIIGYSAGFVNIGKIKGTHNAMKSGMLAAESVWEAVHPSSSTGTTAPDLSSYTTSLSNSWIHSDLYEVRNLRPSFNTSLGIWGGILYSGIDSLFLKGRVPWTFKHQKEPVVSPLLPISSSISPLFLFSFLSEIPIYIPRLICHSTFLISRPHRLPTLRTTSFHRFINQRIFNRYQSRRISTYTSQSGRYGEIFGRNHGRRKQ